eukprot:6160244-Pleurochrysis_carterae.AAC.1
MISSFMQYRMRTSSEQLRHTNARYGGASQCGAALLSREAVRPNSGLDSRRRVRAPANMTALESTSIAVWARRLANGL